MPPGEYDICSSNNLYYILHKKRNTAFTFSNAKSVYILYLFS